jgi:hypothetical protein
VIASVGLSSFALFGIGAAITIFTRKSYGLGRLLGVAIN